MGFKRAALFAALGGYSLSSPPNLTKKQLVSSSANGSSRARQAAPGAARGGWVGGPWGEGRGHRMRQLFTRRAAVCSQGF